MGELSLRSVSNHKMGKAIRRIENLRLSRRRDAALFQYAGFLVHHLKKRFAPLLFTQ